MVADVTVAPGEHVPTADQRLVSCGVPWSHYEAQLALRGDAPVPRIACLERALELTSPSRDHERIQSTLGCLVEADALERGIDHSPYGAWTLKSPPRASGLEPVARLASFLDRPTALQAVRAFRDALRD